MIRLFIPILLFLIPVMTLGQPCQALFSYYEEGPASGVVFTDSSTSASGIDTWVWDFGDGGTGTGTPVTHTYNSTGFYLVCLTISTADSCSSTYCDSILVTVDPCGTFGVQLSITDNGNSTWSGDVTVNGGIPPFAFLWSDGSTAGNPVFQNPGTYCVTVTDSYGCTASACGDAIVYDTCSAFFSWLPDNCGINCITFADNSFSQTGIVSWSWDFGDSQTASVQNPSHVYGNNPGNYGVCLSIVSGGGCSHTYCDTLTLDSIPVPQCDANFNYFADTLFSFTFTDQSSSTDSINLYYWDFGDGTTGYGQNITHSYIGSGFYSVCLTIATADSCSSTLCQNIVIYDPAPVCSASFTVDSVSLNCGPFCMLFSDNTSDGIPVSWSWTFGDGSVSSEQNPVHTFPGPGTYSVCLTITTQQGCIDMYCENITIATPVSCNAAFSVSEAGCANCFAFTYQSTGSNIQTWLWSFGDGSFSQSQSPFHAYSDTGYYMVCLTAGSVFSTVVDSVPVVDTVFCSFCDTVYANTQSVTLFSVSGVVHQNSGIMEEGIVMAYADNAGYFSPVQYVYTTNGEFTLHNIPEGDYHIQAIPDNNTNPDFLPTYYVDKTDWMNANMIQVTGDVFDLDIILQQTDLSTEGNYGIAGNVYYTDPATYETFIYDHEWFSGTGNKSLKTNRARNICVYLYTEEGTTPVQWTLSNTNGYFFFEGLSSGTYRVLAQKPGLSVVSPPLLSLDAENPFITGLDIIIQSQDIIFGVNDPWSHDTDNSYIVYPNPVTDLLMVESKSFASKPVSVKLIDTYGNEVYYSNQNGPSFSIDMSRYAHGIYFLRINSGKEVSIRKVIK